MRVTSLPRELLDRYIALLQSVRERAIDLAATADYDDGYTVTASDAMYQLTNATAAVRDFEDEYMSDAD